MDPGRAFVFRPGPGLLFRFFPLRFFLFGNGTDTWCVSDFSDAVLGATGVVGQERWRGGITQPGEAMGEASVFVVCEILSLPLRHRIAGTPIGKDIGGSNKCPCDEIRLGNVRSSGVEVLGLEIRDIEFTDNAENRRSSHLQIEKRYQLDSRVVEVRLLTSTPFFASTCRYGWLFIVFGFAEGLERVGHPGTPPRGCSDLSSGTWAASQQLHLTKNIKWQVL